MRAGTQGSRVLARSAGPNRGHRTRRDIQGVRAVAVLAVVGFHAGVPGVGGGFVGVDVFFVVSGFLITGQLWAELRGTGRISFGRFYARRARRLLPAALLVLVVTMMASAIILPPREALSVWTDARAAALYVSNYRFAIQGTDYLAASNPPSPIQQYWSLGVEEQFYALWPVLLVVIAAAAAALRARRRRSDKRGRHNADSAYRVSAGAGALVVLALASFALSLHWTRISPPWAFFSLPSRIWELAAGALLAVSAPTVVLFARPIRVLMGWLGLAVVIASIAFISAAMPFPGYVALAPVGGTVLILAAGLQPTRGGVEALLSRRGFQFIGAVSYTWYLWHWPVLILAAADLGHPLQPYQWAAAVLASLVLAVATTATIENRFRYAPWLRPTHRSLLAGAMLTASVAALTLSTSPFIASLAGHGRPAAALALTAPPSRPPSPPLANAATGTAAHQPAGASTAPAPTPAQVLTAQVQRAVTAALTVNAVPSNLQPSLADAAGNKSLPFIDGCLLSYPQTFLPTCAYADTASATTVMLVGDSHAAQWFPAFDQIAVQNKWRLEALTKETCPPLELPMFSPYLGREYTECAQFRQEVLARIRTEHPRLVVLGVARHYGPQAGFIVYQQPWLDGLAAMVREIRALGSQVLVMGAIPKPPADIPNCLSAHLSDVTACDLNRGATVNGAGIAAEQRATIAAGGSYLNVIPLFCTATRCPAIVGANLVYRDDNHLTTYYPAWLTPVISADLNALFPALIR